MNVAYQDYEVLSIKTPVKAFVTKQLRIIGKGRVDLSREIGKSLSYISQVEAGVCNFNPELVDLYVASLGLSSEDARQFKSLVEFANLQRQSRNEKPTAKRVSALISMFADSMSEDELSDFERKLDSVVKRTGVFPYRKTRSFGGGEEMTPDAFIRLVKITDKVRKDYGLSQDFIKINDLVEEFEARDDRFVVEYHHEVPKVINGRRVGRVYGCMLRYANGTEVHYQEEIYRKAFDGCWTSRHIVAHELSHHVLGHDDANLLPDIKTIGNTPVNRTLAAKANLVEREADFAASLLLVPWRRLVGRPYDIDFAARYRDEPKFCQKLWRYVNIPIIRDRLRGLT